MELIHILYLELAEKEQLHMLTSCTSCQKQVAPHPYINLFLQNLTMDLPPTFRSFKKTHRSTPTYIEECIVLEFMLILVSMAHIFDAMTRAFSDCASTESCHEKLIHQENAYIEFKLVNSSNSLPISSPKPLSPNKFDVPR